jgi:hypothetical protein
MTHPAVIKTTQLILAGDHEGAERELAHVAETEGDTALVALLDQVAPKDLLAIMREFDGSRESVVNMVVTPTQFAEAVVLEKRYGDKDYHRLCGMMNAVLYRDESEAVEYLEALGEKEAGVEVLVDYFAGRVDEILNFAMTGDLLADFTLPEPMEVKSITWLSEKIEEVDEALQSGDSILSVRPKTSRAEVSDRDWMETAWILRHELSEVFEQLVIAIRDRLERRMESLSVAAEETATTSAHTREDEEESAI